MFRLGYKIFYVLICQALLSVLGPYLHLDIAVVVMIKNLNLLRWVRDDYKADLPENGC
jgi:hypothetical protein